MDPEATAQAPNESTPATTPAATAQQPPAPRTYSEEEVNAIRQQERNAAAAAARREAEARLKPRVEAPSRAPERNESPAPQDHQIDDEDTRAARRSMFDRAVGRSGLDEEQISLLEIAYRVERPTDPVEWVNRKAKAFGVAQVATPQTATTTTTPTGAPQAATPSIAPATAVPNGNADDVFRWNERQWSAYVQQHGANPGNPYHWSNVKVHQELARKYEASMANKAIVTKK